MKFYNALECIMTVVVTIWI